jgi:tetratricopeptide (TPR) repeat protein
VDGTEPARKYLNAGLTKEALEGRLSKANTHPAPFYYDLGLLYEINGRLDEAEAVYRKAAAIEMNELHLKAVSSIRQAKEDQKRLLEQQGVKP